MAIVNELCRQSQTFIPVPRGSNMHTTTDSTNRLSVLYLLCLSFGMGTSLAVTRGLERLRFPADHLYYGLKRIPDADLYAALVAAVYGVCFTTFLFAWRAGNLWSSPGKILALLFTTMCVLNWTLDLIAAGVMRYRMQVQVPDAMLDAQGHIFGIWYRNLAPSLGYVCGLPVLALVVYKTSQQKFYWRLVWIGFFVFALLIVAAMHFQFDQRLPMSLGCWYFELAIGLPIVLLALAMAISLIWRERLDWWTMITGR